MQEREIDLLDLIVEILLRWRMILVWMLCGAVLLGGFSYIRSWMADVQSHQSSSDPKWSKLLDEEQQRNVKYVLEYEELFHQQLAMEDQSVLLQMNTYVVKKAAATVWITAEDQDRVFAVEDAYEDTIQGGRMVQYIANQLNLPVTAVSELITLSHKSEHAIDVSGYDSFTLSVIHADEQMCRNMMQAATEFLEKEKEDLQKILGEFELTVVAQEPADTNYPSIADKKKAFVNNIFTMQDTIVKKKQAFTEEEERYYDVLLNEKFAGMSDSEAAEWGMADRSTEETGVSIKYVVLGMFLAVFCYAFFVAVGYAFNTKIRFTEDIQQIYSIPQLGSIPNDEREKRFLGIIDRWILTLRDWNKRSFSEEEAVKLASVAVKLKAEQEMLDSVSLVGCGLKDRSLSVCNQLKSYLNQNNIQVNILNNVLYDAQAMSGLENVKGVVLVERAGATLYTEINQELELLKRQEIKVLGGIVVE